jgi:acyl-CoA thioesterase FadM
MSWEGRCACCWEANLLVSIVAFYALQSRVLFHDTMAYGTHHYMTNFKFQNFARETILFGGAAGGESWREELEGIVMLTREAYSLNLGSVSLGETVGILFSYEAKTRSAIRFCFRVIRADARPVSCGFQTVVCVSAATHELVDSPSLFHRLCTPAGGKSVREVVQGPSFAHRLRQEEPAGPSIFPRSIRELGAQVARWQPESSYPRVVETPDHEAIGQAREKADEA